MSTRKTTAPYAVADLWGSEVEKSFEGLETSRAGLSEQEAKLRLDTYGSNIFYGKEKVSVFSLLLKQFLSPLIFLLMGAGTLTFILNEFVDTVVIALAVLLNVSLGFYHEFHAENTLNKLTTYIKDRAKVIRNGVESEIDSAMLVPGDVIKLSYGSRVPADSRIINVNNFNVDEAILTGESLPIAKVEEPVEVNSTVAERTNIAHAGTLVVQGYATAVVYATGNNTEIGKIAGIVSHTGRAQTPLQKGVSSLAWLIFGVVVVIVVGILMLGISRGEPWVPMLILSSAVAVGAVPEALPIVLTVILAIGSERIANKKGIVRKLTAAETLGSTTLIMTDKTGTLTLADMQLVDVKTVSQILSGDLKKKNKEFSNEQKRLLELSLHNVDVSIENPNDNIAEWTLRGRPFEVNIVKASREHNVPLEIISSLESHIVLPFNSTNKFSVAEKDDAYIVMGAPDILLARSKISKEDYMVIESWIEEISREGRRLLGIATIDKKHKHFSIDDITNVNFLGMFAFYDPIRAEVPAAIKNIESYGVKMVLVTGDLVGTAISVARSLEWEVREDQVLSGADLKAMGDDELIKLIPHIKIFARVTPEDKLRIGKLYQKLGEIVAMTGDGVNDAPSLKAMDIGISLGSGSDVAKSAADLVLLDDNFETIALAIEEGRRILSNVRKSFTYLMSNSFDEVFVIGGSLLFNIALPLTALQIIWVNLFTGSLPALAFAFDEDLGGGKGRNKDAHLIFTKGVRIFIFGVGILSSLLLFLLYYILIQLGLEADLARSIFFVCFSSYILFIAFSFRSLHSPIWSYNIFGNKKLNWAVLIALAILILTMTVPFIRQVFELAPFPIAWLPFVLLWLFLNVLLVEGAKYLFKINS